MYLRLAVSGNGIGQVMRLNYLSGIQMKIETGSSLERTVCMDCVTWLCHLPYLDPKKTKYFLPVPWIEGNGVSGRHLRHLVDPDIRDH